VVVRAPAKVNLSLRVLGKRTDGYHDLDTLMSFYRTGRTGATFDAGIQRALERVLAGPDFLFRIERDPSTAESGRAHRLSDVELASRLSFFLWSTVPDAALLDLAERGKLSDPVTLERQVRRMLDDPRSSWSMASQWLELGKLRAFSADPDVPRIRRRSQARCERSPAFIGEQFAYRVLELITADYTYLTKAGAALRHRRRLRQPLPPRHDRPPTRRPPRQGGDPRRDLLRQPHVAGAARQVADAEHPRHAAAAAARERAAARSHGHYGYAAAAHGAAPQEPGLCRLSCAARSARVRAGELRRDRALARDRRAAADRSVRLAARRRSSRAGRPQTLMAAHRDDFADRDES
jgi:hypothetical protein